MSIYRLGSIMGPIFIFKLYLVLSFAAFCPLGGTILCPSYWPKINKFSTLSSAFLKILLKDLFILLTKCDIR